LNHYQFVRLDLDTRARRRRSVLITHRRRAGLQNERSQFAEVPTSIVEIRKAVPPEDGLVGRIPIPRHGAAKSGPESRTLSNMAMAIPRHRNFLR
jgi:hypothetical protein